MYICTGRSNNNDNKFSAMITLREQLLFKIKFLKGRLTYRRQVFNPTCINIDGLVQERRNAVELRLSCTSPSIWLKKRLFSCHVEKNVEYFAIYSEQYVLRGEFSSDEKLVDAAVRKAYIYKTTEVFPWWKNTVWRSFSLNIMSCDHPF